MSGLFWRSVPYPAERFLVSGTELASAIVPDTLSRFAIFETRGHPTAAGPGDVYYSVRDAATVSDADVRAGKRSNIVARFSDLDAAIEWAKAQG